MDATILTEAELRKIVEIDDKSISAVEDAFTWLAEGKVSMPPIMHISVPEHKGDVDIKSAYVSGLSRFAVKLGAGFFENHKRGLPNSPAMMVVLSAETGVVEAVLLDNAYLTDIRTGAAGAVAAKHLAPKDIETAGVVGAGAQGRYQMIGLKRVRDFKRLFVYDRDEERTEQYVREMGGSLNVEIVPASGPEEVVCNSETVVTCTPSRTPYLKASWLRPGMHVTCMGADLPGKQELEAEVFIKADIVVCDRRSQSFTMGELQHAGNAGIVADESQVLELGEITSGKRPGRRSDRQITVCDLTGTGVQDTAIADYALQEAIRRQMGTRIDIGIQA